MKLFGCTTCGDPPKQIPGEGVTMRFLILDFAIRKEKRGEFVSTDTVVVHGYPWKLMIYPRGDNDSSHRDYGSVHLKYVEDDLENFPVNASAIFRSKTAVLGLNKRTFDENNNSWVVPSGCLNRKQMCDDFGSVTIDVEIFIGTERKMIWYPPSVRIDHIATKLFRSTKESDVVFIVGSTGKIFNAHKCVLELASSTLYELVLTDSNDSNDDIDIVLPDVDEAVFEKILKFIYIGEYPVMTNDDENSVKDIFLTADRLNCTDLKLYAESVLIEKYLVPSNAAEMTLFADAHSCALLKEASMKVYVTDPKTVMASENDWSKLAESKDLVMELLIYAVNFGRNTYTYSPVADSTPSEDVDSLDVTSLRERLQKSNLDYDGSREMLVKRWKGAIA
jgi:hypothetical protein